MGLTLYRELELGKRTSLRRTPRCVVASCRYDGTQGIREGMMGLAAENVISDFIM